MAMLEQRVTRLEEEMVTKDFLAEMLGGLEGRLLTHIDQMKTHIDQMQETLRTEFRKESRTQADRVLEAISSGNNPNY